MKRIYGGINDGERTAGDQRDLPLDELGGYRYVMG